MINDQSVESCMSTRTRCCEQFIAHEPGAGYSTIHLSNSKCVILKHRYFTMWFDSSTHRKTSNAFPILLFSIQCFRYLLSIHMSKWIISRHNANSNGSLDQVSHAWATQSSPPPHSQLANSYACVFWLQQLLFVAHASTSSVIVSIFTTRNVLLNWN